MSFVLVGPKPQTGVIKSMKTFGKAMAIKPCGN